jgi:uncharacterized membrane protein
MMAKLTSGFGVLLTVVGIMGYLWTKGAHPIGFGILLIVCGVLADSESRRRRMIWMHIAVLIGLAGFLIPGTMAARNIVRAHRVGGGIEWQTMQRFQEVVSVLCLIYVVICIGSFIQARRTRTTGELAEA